ncbi:tetratricopeptide repeat protein [Prosthecochloris sp. SCSIO W1101]|uniref:tetratricopeptide repeat protein n=1 Tax=Prosthecochloris sp. SCSIO W1101 TaxID=2992242 RepID=UPI00223E27B7|nr:tetratricopeptide repeat protein [Prosthecochloris sp. SCSIO W1101]UZJ42182.1 tetratricopeptide repeat protein [Prosthecochloris sp. SCSIO W1101]
MKKRKSNTVSPSPDSISQRSDSLFRKANALHKSNELIEAETLYKKILQFQPEELNVLQRLATVLAQRERYEEAAGLFERALSLDSENPFMLNNYGNVLCAIQQYEKAFSCFERATILKPDYAEAYYNQANAFKRSSRYDEALKSYDKAIACRSDYVEAYFNSGVLLLFQKRYDEARHSFETVVAFRQDQRAYYHLGIALYELQHYEKALASLEKAVAIKPDFPEALVFQGSVLMVLQRYGAALIKFNKAIEINPHYVEAYTNSGNALFELRRNEEALRRYDKAISLKAGYAEAYWNKSLVLLLLGDFREGWPLYEWRWKKEPLSEKRRDYKQPLWLQQQPLNGRTLYLYYEQGFGDSIQMLRYIPALKKTGATIVLEIQPVLRSPASTIQGIDALVTQPYTGHFDYHLPLMSLPLAMGTTVETIPQTSPYLFVEKTIRRKWAEMLGGTQGKRRRIGIVWSGSTVHKQDYKRSVPFHIVEPLLESDAEFYSLQKEYRDGDREKLERSGRIADFSADLHDFAETAGLIEQLDLVISVDTAVAHLAGAMGKEVWVLLPEVPDYRWLKEGSVSPWYPTMRLFRQVPGEDWKSVVKKVKKALSSVESAHSVSRVFIGNVTAPSLKKSVLLKKARELYRQGKIEQAMAFCDQFLLKEPGHTAALLLLATLHVRKKQFKKAAELFKKALEIKPDNPSVLNNYGNVLNSLRYHEKALCCFDRAIALKPEYAEAYYNRSKTLFELQRYEKALPGFEKALEIKPGFAEAHVFKGDILRKLSRHEEALLHYEKAIVLNPGYALVYNNLGNALQELQRYQEALSCFDKAITLQPDYFNAYNNRGIIQYKLKRYKEALHDYDKAISLKSSFAPAHTNRGAFLSEMQQYEEAILNYDKAIALDPGYAEAYWNKAIALLLLGDYREGWPLYEWRWEKKPLASAKRKYHQPLWLRQQSLAGKTLYLYHEQGFGDSIQMLRYIPALKKTGATVVLEVQPPLRALSASLKGVDTLVSSSYNDTFDYHLPLMSLPLAMRTTVETIPDTFPYLFAEEPIRKKWAQKLGKKAGKRIGIVWSGSHQHVHDDRRSIPFHIVEPLLESDAEFYSLQKEYRDGDREKLEHSGKIADFSADLHDFAETAGLIEQLDLVISVDTAVAHLAGAMGKEVWLLLADVPDFRWMTERTDSPWYTTARLFRQTVAGEWQKVIQRVGKALGDMVSRSEFKSEQVGKGSEKPVFTKQKVESTLQSAFALYKQGRLGDAEHLYREILASDADNVNALHLLATLLAQKMQFVEAVELLGKAAGIAPDNPLIFNNYGNALSASKKYEEALLSYENAIALKPDYAEAYGNRANALKELQRYEEALLNYEKAVSLKPNYPVACYGLGNTFAELKRYEEALHSFESAIELDPHYADAHCNRGNMLKELQRHEEALACFKKALSLKPGAAELHYNIANTCFEVEEYEEALQNYNNAIVLKSGYHKAYWNKSFLLLLLGDYKEGWLLYEWRWKNDPQRKKKRDYQKPLWLQQQVLEEKTLYLYYEQGLGDSIQMLRYIPYLKKAGANIVLEIQSPLRELAAAANGIDKLVTEPYTGHFDYHLPLMSLPLAMKTTLETVPGNCPYLFVGKDVRQRWVEKLGEKKGLQVGVVWAGTARHKNDHKRSIAFEEIALLLENDAVFYSLQKEYREGELAMMQRSGGIVDCSAELHDFSETAGLIEQLDLVISVDTAVAHLAGALGKEVWLLLPAVPDFRWLTEREDSPWYPTITLFRQASGGGWKPLIKSVSKALNERVACQEQ